MATAGCGLYTEDALRASRAAAHDRALRSFLAASEAEQPRRAEGDAAGSKEPAPKQLTLEDALRLTSFYARKLPELCTLSGAPSDSMWTSIVLYKEFFAVRTPLEFDPLPMMFACVYVACKIEEFHKMTLDRLLGAAGLASDESMQARVLSLELPLLEGVGFEIHVEPKPSPSLCMLAGEVESWLRSEGLAVISDWPAVTAEAEALIAELAAGTDALLRLPASALFAGALRAAIAKSSALDARSRAAAEKGLDAVLRSSLGTDAQQHSLLEALVESVAAQLRGPALERLRAEDDVKSLARAARRGQRFFERLRSEAVREQEAGRLARKRTWTASQGGGGGYTQLLV